MGSYLVVDGVENNTKSISYPMINFFRKVLPERKSLEERFFLLNQEDVSKILLNLTVLIEEKEILEKYMEENKDCYGLDGSYEDVLRIFQWIHNCFCKILPKMIINKKEFIICSWV